MCFEDSVIILDSLVKELFRSRFPEQAEDEELRECLLSMYLDFVYDKTGYWTTVKTALLMNAQFIAKAGDTPAETAAVSVRIAREKLKLEAKNHKKNRQVIPLFLPLPRWPKHRLD
jgi:hypothetical protein